MGDGAQLAVDFGTSHTVAICRWGGNTGQPLLFDASPLLPSAVLAVEDNHLFVGRDAIRASRSQPAQFEPHPKRCIDERTLLLGPMEVPVTDAIAAVLRRCLDEATRAAGQPPARTVLTCPAAWASPRRATLAAAAAQAGLHQPSIVPEPVAAAVYFTNILGRDVPPGAPVLVYDLGAGTFDVALVRRLGTHDWSVVASDGLPDVGGLELDDAIVRHLGATYERIEPERWDRLSNPATPADLRARRALWEEVQAAKEQLSRTASAGVHLPLLEVDVHVTRAEFEQIVRPLLDRTVALTAATLAGAAVTPAQLAGVFLVGGSSRVPLVATLLHQRLGVVPTVIEQPEMVVAQGALLTLDAASDEAEPPGPTVPLPLPGPGGHPRAPAGGRRRQPLLRWLAAAVVALAIATVVIVVLDREPEDPLAVLTDRGRKNEAVIKSPSLRAFAHRWLNTVSSCEQRPADVFAATATEYVVCYGDRWEVQFRALTAVAGRGPSRQIRVENYHGDQRSFTGKQPKSGIRIDYRYTDGTDDNPVVYWDDDRTETVGDLTTDALTPDDLDPIWKKHVT